MNELCRLIDQRNADQMVWRTYVEGEFLPKGIAWYGTMEAFLVWDDKEMRRQILLKP